MTDTFLRLAQTLPGVSTPVTVYTSPGATQTIIRHIRIANVTGSASNITLYDGGSSTGNTILPATTVPGGSVLEMDVFITMAAGGTFLATTSVVSSLAITVYGMQIS